MHRQFGQFGQGARDTNGADGDPTLTNAQIIVEAANRLEHSVNVEQRLAHAHKHHVGRTAIHHFADAEHLVNDFMRRQRALKPPFPGRAKAASHRATHLA